MPIPMLATWTDALVWRRTKRLNFYAKLAD